MFIVDCEQYSDEWWMARLGIPTASQFHRIITPTGKASAQANGYVYALAAERYLGEPMSQLYTEAQDRGGFTEPEALKAYAFERGVKPEPVGFVYRDANRMIGASPDCLVDESGLLEIKCPLPHTHIEYLCGESPPAKYKPQIQGQLYVTGREWCDFMTYCPRLPYRIFRVERDEEYIAKLDAAIGVFLKMLIDVRERLHHLT